MISYIHQTEFHLSVQNIDTIDYFTHHCLYSFVFLGIKLKATRIDFQKI